MVLRRNIKYITKGAIRRLARRAGVRRLSATVYEDVRQAMKYPAEDNNKGLTYGINVLSRNNLAEAEVLEVFWFKSADARSKFVTKHNMKILNETT